MDTTHRFITETADEAQLLIAVIDNWLEGLPAAEDATIQDHTIGSPEELLELVGSYEEQKQLLERFKKRLVVDYERHTYGG
jgi:hypothetical protein